MESANLGHQFDPEPTVISLASDQHFEGISTPVDITDTQNELLSVFT